MEHQTRELRRVRIALRRRVAPRFRGRLAVLAGIAALAVAGCSTGAGSTLTGASSPLADGHAPPAAHATSPSDPANPVSWPASGLVSPSKPGRGSHAVPPGSEPSGLGSRSGVTGGALFGGDHPLVVDQGRLGRKLSIVRSYYINREKFPMAKDRKLMEAGTTLLASLDFTPGFTTYAAIAAGREDDIIRPFLQAMESAAVTYHLSAIYFCFEHEADGMDHHSGLGSPAQFIQAWDHVHQLAVDAHLDWNQGGRLHWVMILTHFGYIHGVASQYFPGTNEVDIIGVDGYNAADCRDAKQGSHFRAPDNDVETPADIFGAALAFARSHGGLPLFIGEWASVAYSAPSIQPGYIHSMQEYVTSNPEIAAALYWNSFRPPGSCDYIINSIPDSLSALTAMAHAAGMQGHIASS